MGIEVCFKILKQHLKLEKEAQLRDYDGPVGHTTVVMIRLCFSPSGNVCILTRGRLAVSFMPVVTRQRI